MLSSHPLRSRLTPLLLAAGLGLASVGVSVAGDHGSHRDPVAKMSRHLSLDESQKASVSAMFERNRPAKQALHERRKTHHQALRALDPTAPDYSTRAQALADEAATLAREAVLQHTQFKAEMATVLTPEQLTKMQQHKGRHGRGDWHRKGSKEKSDSAS